MRHIVQEIKRIRNAELATPEAERAQRSLEHLAAEAIRLARVAAAIHLAERAGDAPAAPWRDEP